MESLDDYYENETSLCPRATLNKATDRNTHLPGCLTLQLEVNSSDVREAPGAPLVAYYSKLSIA